MSPSELRSRLQGVVGFPVTPFKADLSLDLDGLRRNLRAMLQHPPAAIVAAGGTGELYSLSPTEHLAVVGAAVEEARGAVPVIAGVGFNGPIAAGLARQAGDAGASGILAFPPYYPGGEDDGLLQYYQTIGNATGLGLIIYSRDWFHPSAALVDRLAAAIPNLVAWKDGQGDIRRLQILRAQVGDRLHWIGGAGDDLVPAYYGIGIRAFTSSVANVSSKIAWQLHDTASKGDCGSAPDAHVHVRRSGLRAPRETPRLRGLGDEVADGPARPCRRARPPAARQSSRRKRSRRFAPACRRGDR